MNAKLFKTCTVLFLSGFLLFAACTRPPEPSPKTKAELLAAAPWKYSQAGIDQNSDGTIDIPLPASLLQACATDNILTFKADSSGVVDEGATKCVATTPQMVPFTWGFLNNETEINFSTAVFAGISGAAKIVELSETKLALSKLVPITGFPIPLTVTVILIH